LDLKPIVTDERVAAGDKRKELRKELKELFEKKYKELPANEGNSNSKSSHLRFLFKKLKF
jgi:Ribosomal L27e protein family